MKSYKIPSDLNQSYLSMNISVSTKDGSVARVVSMKVVVWWLFSLLGCFYIVSKTFIGQGSILQIAGFVILWLIWSIVLGMNDATNRQRWQWVASLLGYLPKANRVVMTRSGSPYAPFYGIVGIKEVSPKGRISFTDGSFGFMYRVVGSASILLFDSDKDAILNRVDGFYRKVQPDFELLFMTVKEPQQVARQIAHLTKLYKNLNTDDADLRALMEGQFTCLKTEIGTEYRSIHQYLIVKADNVEALMRAKQILQSEIEGSSLMYKQCIALTTEDSIGAALKAVYGRG